jgi:hypothetical protein
VVLVRQIRGNALTSCFEREVARVRDYMLEGGCKFGRDGNNPAGLSKVSTSGSTRLRSTSGRKTSIVSSLKKILIDPMPTHAILAALPLRKDNQERYPSSRLISSFPGLRRGCNNEVLRKGQRERSCGSKKGRRKTWK